MQESELIIEGIVFPRFSSRGVRQTLTNIKTSELKRTINGELLYLGQASHHKFKCLIQCQDLKSIGLNDLWVGSMVNVSCIVPLIQRFEGVGPFALMRKARGESIRVDDTFGHKFDCEFDGDKTISINGPLGPYEITYLPILQMRITAINTGVHEWDAQEQWSLELEEV